MVNNMLDRTDKIKFVNIFWALFYILVFILLLRGGFSYLDPDLGWHLKVGEEIAVSGQIPQENHFNYTYTGNWVDHEWLSDLLVYHIYNSLGYEALVIIFALLVILVLVILNIFVNRVSKNKIPFFVIAILQLFGVLASSPHFGVRIQELALLFLLLLLILLEAYNKRQNWLLLILFFPLFYFWANFHASFLLGLIILFSWLGIKVVERLVLYRPKWSFWFNRDKILAWPKLVIFFVFSLLSIIFTLLTPYGFKLYDFLGGYRNRAYLSLIQEWLPQYSFPFHYDQLIYLALGASVLILYLYYVYKKEKKVEIWPLFLILVFLVLSFQSRRHFPLFFIVSFVSLSQFYGELFQDIRIDYKKCLQGLTLVCLILVIFVQFLNLRPFSNPFNRFCSDYPCWARGFLENNPIYLEGNMFNDYGWGGFLIWTLPGKKLFIDGRLPQIEFAGQTFIEEYRSFFAKKENQAEKLEEYNIKVVLIRSRDEKNIPKAWEKIIFNIKDENLENENYLRQYLEESDDWQLVYQDEVARVYNKIFETNVLLKN
jgi:hypothetical protein